MGATAIGCRRCPDPGSTLNITGAPPPMGAPPIRVPPIGAPLMWAPKAPPGRGPSQSVSVNVFGSRSLRGLPPTIDGSLPGLPLTIDGGSPPTSSVRRTLARCLEASSHTLSEPQLALFPCGCNAAHHVAHPLRKPWPLGGACLEGLGLCIDQRSDSSCKSIPAGAWRPGCIWAAASKATPPSLRLGSKWRRKPTRLLGDLCCAWHCVVANKTEKCGSLSRRCHHRNIC